MYQLDFDRDIGWNDLAFDHSQGIFHRQLSHGVRILRNGRRHGPYLDRLSGIGDGIKSDDDDLAGTASGCDSFDGSERHYVVAGKHRPHL